MDTVNCQIAFSLELPKAFSSWDESIRKNWHGIRIPPSFGQKDNMRKAASWSPPNLGWLKLNFDGASRGNPGPSGIRYVIRDHTGAILGGGASRGRCGSKRGAELAGVAAGLDVAVAGVILRAEAVGKGPLSLVSQKADGQFSYCLPNYLSARATGSLNLGKDSIPSSVKVYTPMQKEPKFASSVYILGLEGISVGGQRLSLVKPVYNALRASFEEKMKTYAPAVKPASPFGDFQPCYQLSNITSVKIPIVTLHFKGNANFDVPAVGTLLQVSSDVVCFPFSPSPNDAVNVIGNVQQQGITLAFDNLNNRIGFGSGSC
ncbi:aspartyl protease family protein 2-like [Cryptomeria japonica]|uniref:aspartyl protease family protein 2-like n=1 Tax=Cryptomeria japonica TaxID=3369 RepID=UPI0027DA5914|nr:aspartyl protease family protein 2-like [Cryptomeria japonica]